MMTLLRNRGRMWLLLSLLVIGAAAAPAARAQGLSGPDIKLSGVTSIDRAAAGSKLEAALVMEIPSPFHVNAHKPNETWLRPTTLTLKSMPFLTFGPVRYPQPLSKTFGFSPNKPLLVYEGHVVIRFPVTVSPKAKAGAAVIRGEVEYQACNDKACFIPRTRPVQIPITVAAAGTKGKPINPDVFAVVAGDAGIPSG